MKTVLELAQQAVEAKYQLATLPSRDKDAALRAIADELENQCETILAANAMDCARGREKGLSSGLLDRLMLDRKRVFAMAEGCRQVAALEDPVGEVLSMKTRPNGLKIGVKRVPMGVIGMIYEARPNVTVDAAVLCFKAGSAVILRGGKEAYHSNRALTDLMQRVLRGQGLPESAIQLVDDTSRESANEMMRLNGYLDVLIPRGGKGLIQSVVQNATVPVIETGIGNCHIYVDEGADLAMAADILRNAKCSRVSVCNAAESLLVHQSVAQEFLPLAKQLLDRDGVEWRGCPRTCAILPGITPATEEDYHAEFGDYILSCKIVDSCEEAIDHINRYNTGHSEAIITQDYAHAQDFLDQVDAAAVYVNASTRFTDGYEFGFGAEIGISTQRLHARGPMGLKELTTVKYIIYGNGQIR